MSAQPYHANTNQGGRVVDQIRTRGRIGSCTCCCGGGRKQASCPGLRTKEGTEELRAGQEAQIRWRQSQPESELALQNPASIFIHKRRNDATPVSLVESSTETPITSRWAADAISTQLLPPPPPVAKLNSNGMQTPWQGPTRHTPHTRGKSSVALILESQQNFQSAAPGLWFVPLDPVVIAEDPGGVGPPRRPALSSPWRRSGCCHPAVARMLCRMLQAAEPLQCRGSRPAAHSAAARAKRHAAARLAIARQQALQAGARLLEQVAGL